MSSNLPFTPRLPPLIHQQEFLDENSRRPYFALFWEQGTGKTKALIDNMALLLMEGEIDCALVLAPNGVHRNWHVEELPKHWPADAPPYVSFSWDTYRTGTKAYDQEYQGFLGAKRFKILCMSYDSLMTKPGQQASWHFIRKSRVFCAADESQCFKTPDAARTKRVIALGAYPEYKRVASGTPMDTPFDIYSQVRFLDPLHWMREQAVGTFTAFKARFANIKQMTTVAGRTYPLLTGYKDLDALKVSVDKIGSRVLKVDVLDLPKKTYNRMFHPLTLAQRRAYDELRDECLTIMDSGELVTAEMALVLRLRLRQVTSGFIRSVAGGPDIKFSPNPRAQLIQTVLENATHPTIIWAGFTHDVEIAREASLRARRRPVVFDGSKPELSVDVFHAGKADDIIAHVHSNMALGYTLNEAKSSIYYSRSPRLIARMQSEDRNHRIGQDGIDGELPFIDLLAEGTLDVKELSDLRAKRSITGQVLGDSLSITEEWLSPQEKSENIREWFKEALNG